VTRTVSATNCPGLPRVGFDEVIAALERRFHIPMPREVPAQISHPAVVLINTQVTSGVRAAPERRPVGRRRRNGEY
jgi:hypothetical protein